MAGTSSQAQRRRRNRLRGLAESAPELRRASWYDEPIHFEPSRPRVAFRTVWISDTHLGTAGCNAELLLDFLRSIECETLLLVGDIVDGWQLRKGWYWPPRHNDIVRCVLKMAKHERGSSTFPATMTRRFAIIPASTSAASRSSPRPFT